MNGEGLYSQVPEKRLDPIRRELYAKLFCLTADLNWREANRESILKTLNHFYPSLEAHRKRSEDKGYEKCMSSWCRALGNRILNKRHLIDAVVLTTERLNENEVALLAVKKEMLMDMEKIAQEIYIGLPPSSVDFAKYIEMIKKVTTP